MAVQPLVWSPATGYVIVAHPAKLPLNFHELLDYLRGNIDDLVGEVVCANLRRVIGGFDELPRGGPS